MPAVKNSILDDTKKVLGMDADYDAFDLDIVLFINAAISTLRQLGVGPQNGFSITGSDEVWEDLLGKRLDLDEAKAYIAQKVRLMFDPPQTSFAIAAFEKMIAEAEWRLNVTIELRPQADKAAWWAVKDGEEFPPEAKIGDYGYDPVTKNVWEKTA